MMANINAGNRKFTNEDIFFYKLWKCIVVYIRNFLEGVKDILYYNHPYSNKGKEGLDAFCCKISGNKCKKTFGKSSALSGAKFYLAFCIFLKIKNSAIVTDAKMQLFPNLEDIREIRNKISHKSHFSIQELEQFKNQLIKLVENISSSLVELIDDPEVTFDLIPDGESNLYSELAENAVTEIKEFWDLNITEASEIDDLVDIYDSDEFRQFASESRKELSEVYKYLASTPYTSFPGEYFKFSLDDVYVPMTLIIKDSKGAYCESVQKIILEDSLPSVTILSGEAAQGKTTLCKKIVLMWTTDKETELKKYDMVFFIDVKTLEETTMAEYLRNKLVPHSLQYKKLSDDDIIAFCKELKILIIIDGYDKCKESNEILSDVLDVFPDSKFIITTSPKYLSSLQISLEKTYDKEYSTAQLNGFSNSQECEFVEKVCKEMQKKNFKGVHKNHDSFPKFVDYLPAHFKCLIKTPYMIYLIIFFWLNHLETPFKQLHGTVTSIYSNLFSFQKDFAANSCINLVNGTRSTLAEKISKILDSIGKYCYECKVSKKKPVFDDMKQQLQNENGNEKDTLAAVLATFFSGAPSLGNICRRNEAAIDYSHTQSLEFINKLQVDFFASHYAFSLLKEHPTMKLTELSLFERMVDPEQTSKIFAMTLGLLNMRGVSLDRYRESIFNILKGYADNYNMLWTVFHESACIQFSNEAANVAFKPSAVVSDVIKTVKKTKQHETWKLDITNIVSAVSLLQYVDLKVSCLEIKISEPSDSFATLSELHNLKLKDPVPCTVNVDMASKSGKEEISAEVLKVLGGWAKLESFTGPLDVPGVKLLQKYSDCLESIDIILTSVDVLKELDVMCTNKECKLKQIALELRSMDEKELKCIPKLKNFKGRISIDVASFQTEVAKDILKKLIIKSQKFACVRITLDSKESMHAKELMNELSGIIDRNGTLTIYASFYIEDDILNELKPDSLKVNWE